MFPSLVGEGDGQTALLSAHQRDKTWRKTNWSFCTLHKWRRATRFCHVIQTSIPWAPRLHPVTTTLLPTVCNGLPESWDKNSFLLIGCFLSFPESLTLIVVAKRLLRSHFIMLICVCVCVRAYMCVCVRVCLCACVCVLQGGKTPLFYAAHRGDIGICKLLVDKGADVNAGDKMQMLVSWIFILWMWMLSRIVFNDLFICETDWGRKGRRF